MFVEYSLRPLEDYKNLSFAGAHWQMNNDTLPKSTRKHVKLDKFIGTL